MMMVISYLYQVKMVMMEKMEKVVMEKVEL